MPKISTSAINKLGLELMGKMGKKDFINYKLNEFNL